MTRLSAVGARSPVRAHHLPAEDRLTYRRWARRAAIAYCIIIAVLAIGLSLHDRGDAQLASRDQTTGTGTAMKAAPRVTGTIITHQ
ncbi:hypothetical protein JQ633_05660 [Bradyrhizobium tropiciagri]|uniref:hypothetical protein n=1 Tax=Bradyrhizobium tropiciagri TaxID=312253 RepID=UPI001BADBAB3|nr:hypothetical protein [Bradyrhizobium tropiciagri]MBR0869833.1 hypothetical protein [Bradyrhizobium tropiciagri]